MRVRAAAVQFQYRPVASFGEFAAQVNGHVAYAHDCRARLLLFPEYVTAPLLGIYRDWDHWTEPYLDLFRDLAKQTGIYLAAGTHRVKEENVAYLFYPDGSYRTQKKIHMTPWEKEASVQEAPPRLSVFDTEVGKLAILICYDVEFPEAVRAACEAGAEVLLVPSLTDDRRGYWRVRYCCHARTVENQVYVLHAPATGGIPALPGYEQAFGRAGILTPCDLPFPQDGLMAEGEWNQDLCIVGDLDLALLREIHAAGSVTPRLDRKPGYEAAVD
jgi:predicted amidohydrolase